MQAMDEKTDEEIAKKVQLGDVQSFGLLIERYEPKITRYAKNILQAGLFEAPDEIVPYGRFGIFSHMTRTLFLNCTITYPPQSFFTF